MASHPSTVYQAVPPAKTLEMFAADLSSSVKNAIIQRRYTDVFVLAFHWENDDMGVAPLEAQLLEVRHLPLRGRELYHSDCRFAVPIGDSSRPVVRKTSRGRYPLNRRILTNLGTNLCDHLPPGTKEPNRGLSHPRNTSRQAKYYFLTPQQAVSDGPEHEETPGGCCDDESKDTCRYAP